MSANSPTLKGLLVLKQKLRKIDPLGAQEHV